MLSKGKGFMGVFQGHFTYVVHQERPYHGTSPEYTFFRWFFNVDNRAKATEKLFFIISYFS